MANIFTVAASHAPSEQLLRKTDFAEKSNYKVIRGNHTEVTFLVLIIKINWKKKMLYWSYQQMKWTYRYANLWNLRVIRVWKKLKKVSERMGKIKELMAVFISGGGLGGKKFLPSLWILKQVCSLCLVQLFCISLIQDVQLWLYLVHRNVEEYKEIENTFWTLLSNIFQDVYSFQPKAYEK